MRQLALCHNMQADFLFASKHDAEIQSFAPEAESVLVEVATRSEDTSSAASLASVLTQHTRLFAEATGVLLAIQLCRACVSCMAQHLSVWAELCDLPRSKVLQLQCSSRDSAREEDNESLVVLLLADCVWWQRVWMKPLHALHNHTPRGRLWQSVSHVTELAVQCTYHSCVVMNGHWLFADSQTQKLVSVRFCKCPALAA